MQLVFTRSLMDLPVFGSTLTDSSTHSPMETFDFLPLNHGRLRFLGLWINIYFNYKH